jgi:hypothetical protein
LGKGTSIENLKQVPKYSDSYFYNSPQFKYPTINDQKKLARSIAETLEGSNVATSKYHKKKETLNRQFEEDDFEGESQCGNFISQNDYYSQSPSYKNQQNRPLTQVLPTSLIYDDTVPEIIKRSIAQANMTDPLRNVHAPESFKEKHFTEHSTHTLCPPKAAMTLAAALENNETRGKGGRGTELFQKRKARMEKLAESDEKKNSHQQFQYDIQVQNQHPQQHYLQQHHQQQHLQQQHLQQQHHQQQHHQQQQQQVNIFH